MGRPRPPRIGEQTTKGIGFLAHCHGCDRRKHYPAEVAARLFGPDTSVGRARERLRCSACGTRGSKPPGITLEWSLADFARTSSTFGRLEREREGFQAARRARVEEMLLARRQRRERKAYVPPSCPWA